MFNLKPRCYFQFLKMSSSAASSAAFILCSINRISSASMMDYFFFFFFFFSFILLLPHSQKKCWAHLLYYLPNQQIAPSFSLSAPPNFCRRISH